MAKATSGTGSGTHNVYSSFPIAAIGGSEGSLQALQELIRQLPQQPGLTLVYLPNLYETGAEDAAGLLSSETEMKVVVAEHGQALQPDHIYLLDPEQDNRLAQEKFQITRKKDTGAYPAPFDQWLASLAENDSHPLIGILLSGSAIDGITGLRTLQSAGGLTLVQDETAVSLSGPKTAVAQGVADKVLPPPAMAEELIALVERSGSIQEKGVILQEPEISENDENLARIIQYLKKSIGVDFTHYKMNTIKRRITRRMLLHKLSFLSDYLQYLKQHTGEVSLLYQDLLINVTTFFRDPDALEYLKKTLLPRILRNKSASDPLRIWVPACSTGEEPYTLAIILMEFLGDKAANIPIQIFATDLSELAIAKARLGVYSRDELANINPQQLQRFFTKIDGSYRIIKPIRDLCVYAPHNVFKDPPFSRLDLISCCNLMIYMDTVLHKKLLSTFHYSLNPEGLLVLGKSETIGSSVQLFTQLEKRFKIYVKKESSTHGLFDMNYRLPHLMGNSEKSELHQSALKRTQYVSDLEKMVDEVLLSKYVPASVVISLDLEILQFKGSTGLYLEPAPGKASLNLMKMAKPGLGFEVRNLVNKCNKTGQTVRKKNIEVNWQEKRLLVSVEVMPLRPSGEDRLFLVVFEQCAPEAPPESRKDFSRDKLVHQLQEELIAVKDDMRSIIEEQEASNEELQSANEEIISSNEELQSINEELETSKEELESTNEELVTINAELQMRNDQLAEAQEYADAVFNTIQKAIVVLDKDLRVKSANKAFFRIFRVREEDTQSVLIYELGNRQWDIPELRILLEEILSANTEFHGLEVTHTFQHIGRKHMLLNAHRLTQTSNHTRHFILLAIDDITEQRQLESTLKEREEYITNLTDHIPVMIWTSGPDKLRQFFNRTWLEFTGRRIDQEGANGWMENIHKDDLEIYFKAVNEGYEQGKAFTLEYRLRRHDGKYCTIRDNAQPLFGQDGRVTGYIGSCILVQS